MQRRLSPSVIEIGRRPHVRLNSCIREVIDEERVRHPSADCRRGRAASAQQRPLVTEDPETIGTGNVLHRGRLRLAARGGLSGVRAQGNLLRLPTLGVSFGFSSILELQIDGGLLQSPEHHVDRAGAALRQARVHRRQDARRRGHRRRDQDPGGLRGPGPAGDRRAAGDEAAERRQRERARPRHDGLLRRRARSERPCSRCASSATSASASWRTRSKATARTMC